MVANEIAAFRPPRHSTVNAEPVDVDVDAEQGLDDAHEQDDHVVPAFEEAQAQSPDNECRDQREDDEAAEVVPIGDVGAADRARGEVVAQEAGNEE